MATHDTLAAGAGPAPADSTGADIVYLNARRSKLPPIHETNTPAKQGQALFEARARWGALTPLPDGTELRGPRHQTLRRRGAAVTYPRPADLDGAVSGRLQVYGHGLAFTPDADSAEAMYFLARQITKRLFYKDSIMLVISSNLRIVIGLDPRDAEVVDVLCQAYL